jgi:hypothetical protein
MDTLRRWFFDRFHRRSARLLLVFSLFTKLSEYCSNYLLNAVSYVPGRNVNPTRSSHVAENSAGPKLDRISLDCVSTRVTGSYTNAPSAALQNPRYSVPLVSI